MLPNSPLTRQCAGVTSISPMSGHCLLCWPTFKRHWDGERVSRQHEALPMAEWHLTDIGSVSACTFKLVCPVVVLDIGAREDLFSLYGWNGNVLVKKSPEIQIVTDVSPSGYGVTYLDLSGKLASNAPKCTRSDS